MSDLRLAPHERDSTLWRAIAAHLEDRLATLRLQNDASQTPEKTEHLRGRIAEVKALLGLGDERKQLVD